MLELISSKNIWFFGAILSAFFFSLTNIFTKKSQKKISVLEFMILFYFFFVGFSLVLYVFFGKNFMENWLYVGILMVSSIFNFVSQYSIIKSYSNFKVGEVISVLSYKPFILLLLTIFFLSEEINLFYLFPMISMVIGTYFVYGKKFFLMKGKKYSLLLLSVLSGGISDFLIYYLTTKNMGIISINFYSSFFVFLLVLIAFKMENLSLKALLVNKKHAFFSFVAVLFSILATLLYLFSIKFINASVVSSIGQLQILFVVLTGYFILREKLSVKKVIGICTILLSSVVFYLI